jgi:ribosomal protein S18 acetylase RimI-like enzyme
LLTFEKSDSWWIQSVYVEKDYRRQGHFKSLFNEACRLGKSRGVHSIKLYAESENEKAKQTYRSLGMQMNGEKFYTYDFVYGKTKISEFKEKTT